MYISDLAQWQAILILILIATVYIGIFIMVYWVGTSFKELFFVTVFGGTFVIAVGIAVLWCIGFAWYILSALWRISLGG